jgi:protein-tyrosine phosphatase
MRISMEAPVGHEPIRICFVCLGNICRSPTAEGTMRHIVESAALTRSFFIDSAGTSAHHVGERADPRARDAAERRGIVLESRARRFEGADFERFDFVLAMDADNLSALRQLPEAKDYTGHIGLLRAFDHASPTGAEVPDPYYGGEGGFDEVLDLCEAACRGLLEHVQQRLSRP